MDIIVQKFGGTSLIDKNTRKMVAEKIITKYNKGNSIVVIVSAMGRKGDSYSTDSLMDLVNKEFISKRDLDLLLSCGEIISAVVLANVLNSLGYDTSVLTGFQAGIKTNNRYGNAEVISVFPDKIIKQLNQNKIVIITGFQGITENGEITTLGRGGSDITALVIGEALKCETVEIYTDVNGIMTADPRIVPNARIIDFISYDELYQLAEDGAKVIHSKAVEIAENANIKIKIKNTLNDCEGTIVTNKKNLEKEFKNKINKKIINAIAYKNNRVQIKINEDINNDNTNKLMYEIMENNISIDLINFLKDKKIFTIDSEYTNMIESLLKQYVNNYEIVKDCCKLSIIGHRMKGIPGVMSQIIVCLNKQGVEILQTTDSHTTIWCLIKERDCNKAVKTLHKEFNLGVK